jgi:Ca-activated chloride channel homolog
VRLFPAIAASPAVHHRQQTRRVVYLPLILLLTFQQSSTFRAEVRVVRVDAEVRQDARSIDGLTREDFQVTDEGKPQDVMYFGHTEEPLDLILLFDTSGSMLPAIEQVATVSRLALGALRSDDRVAVMAFDADTDLIADFTSDLADVDATIRNVVLKRPPVANSQLQPAAADTARHFLRQPRSNRRRAVLVVTDNMGSSREERAARVVWEADAVVSAVVVPGMAAMRRRRMMFPGAWFGFGSIDGIVKNTGGDVLKSEDAGDGFRRVIERLRSRYSLHYAMPDGKPGKARAIKVELTREAARRHPGARVHARTGYVVPGR